MYRIVTIVTGFLFAVSSPFAQIADSGAEITSRSVIVEVDEGLFEIQEVHAFGELPELPAFESALVPWSADGGVSIGQAVTIDENTVWGGWAPGNARFSAYPIDGDGTPDFEFSSLSGSGRSTIASAKGADRSLYFEVSFTRDRHTLHAFTSQSDGVPDWSIEVPPVPSGQIIHAFRWLSVSYDGSTAAAVFRDSEGTESTLYIFDPETGEVTTPWVEEASATAVELTDDGSMALVSHNNRAKLIDTLTGEILFDTLGTGGAFHNRISGDGHVIVLGGSRLDVYELGDGTYEKVIEFVPPDITVPWLRQSYVVSRDGSTVGVFVMDANDVDFLEGEVFIFDVASTELLGSHPVSGTGEYQGSAVATASSDDGNVIAFASWGTQFNDWPEIMVFNRQANLIGEIDFPGSALSVDVSSDGQYVVGASKAVHANESGSGGSIVLIEPMPIANEGSPEEIAGRLGSPNPNPVDGYATLTLAIETGQHVSVEVYDLTGRRVQSLFNGALASGASETLRLDASNLPAGVYVVRATGEDFSEKQRVTVIK